MLLCIVISKKIVSHTELRLLWMYHLYYCLKEVTPRLDIKKVWRLRFKEAIESLPIAAF